MTPVASRLGGCETFSVVVGAAAGALIGLQFVVMTLIAERPPEKADEASTAFASPTVVHFSLVLFLAALFAVPCRTLWIVAALWLATGLGGTAMMLLFVGIHNAWDNVAYYVIVHRIRKDAGNEA